MPTQHDRTNDTKPSEALLELLSERSGLPRALLLRAVRLYEASDPKHSVGHLRRVAEISCELFADWATRRGMPADEQARQIDMLRIAASLHEIGKVGVPDPLLRKPGKLDSSERDMVQRYPSLGAAVIQHGHSELERAAFEVILYHRSRWDGAGYPTHAEITEAFAQCGRDAEHAPAPVGASIPIFARCVCLADTFDALLSRRAHKEPWPRQRVRETILAESGRQFDPELVQILQERFETLCRLHECSDAEVQPSPEGSCMPSTTRADRERRDDRCPPAVAGLLGAWLALLVGAGLNAGWLFAALMRAGLQFREASNASLDSEETGRVMAGVLAQPAFVAVFLFGLVVGLSSAWMLLKRVPPGSRPGRIVFAAALLASAGGLGAAQLWKARQIADLAVERTQALVSGDRPRADAVRAALDAAHRSSETVYAAQVGLVAVACVALALRPRA